MIIENVRIDDYRSIYEAEINNLDKLNIFIGKNNSGKSNILRAIDSYFKIIANMASNKTFFVDNTLLDKNDFHYHDIENDILLRIEVSFSKPQRDIIATTLSEDLAGQSFHFTDNTKFAVTLQCSENKIFINKIAIFNFYRDDLFNEELTIFDIVTADYEVFEDIKTLRDISVLRKIINDHGKKQILTYTINKFVNDNYYLSGKIRPIVDKEPTLNQLSTNIDIIAKELNYSDEEIANCLKTISTPNVIPSVVFRIIEEISNNAKVLYIPSKRDAASTSLADSFLALKLKKTNRHILSHIISTINDYLGVEIDAFKGDDETAVLDVDDFLLELNGCGIQETIKIILEIILTEPSILLIEEPEVYLHPGLEKKMFDFFEKEKGNYQIILTTHSTNFIDVSQNNNTYLVKNGEVTSVQLLTDATEATGLILKELGVSLSSVFLFDRLVMVEGYTDEDIFSAWASKLGLNFKSVNLGFIHMNGVNNYAAYATEETLSFLTKRQTQMWFVIDQDERTSSDFLKLETMLKGRAKIFILKKRQIENYLFYPEAISEWLETRLSTANKSNIDPKLLSPKHIEKRIVELADELKLYTINKRFIATTCKSIHPNREQLMDGGESQLLLITLEGI